MAVAFVAWALFVGTVAAQPNNPDGSTDSPVDSPDLFLVVLGIAQDAGYPQAGCEKQCCQAVVQDPKRRRFVSSVAVVDRKNNERYVFDCTPDFREQLVLLNQTAAGKNEPDKNDKKKNAGLSGIFLTHAHIGHYTGLMHLGLEAMGTSDVPVYGMPRMKKFLSENGPWSQLVKLGNIQLMDLADAKPVKFKRFSVTPFLVPHRDEFSETVGFRISSASKTIVYLPDIDKWSKWDQSIEKLVEGVDVALLDGSFFANGEIPGRDMSLIPHPFVTESITRFSSLDAEHRKRVKFIHLNHTNPVLQTDSAAARQVKRAGMGIAGQGEIIEMN